MSFFSNLFKSKKVILRERRDMLARKRNEIAAKNRKSLNKKLEEQPLLRTKNEIITTLNQLKLKRKSINEQWIATYETFSWWNKLKYPERLDLSELDEPICELENLHEKFNAKYSGDVAILSDYYRKAIERSEYRIDATYNNLLGIIEKNKVNVTDEENLFSRAFWFSALSIPISAWGDFVDATNVYDSLRKVNDNFQDMSDIEIWWESLWMSKESLSGLVSLTKGAYFEKLVAEDTGGKLFEHFNNPDTDIAIDGVLFQLKATDSVSYIATVDEETPVIATTEVAEKTGVIDGGYSNEELTNTVELALGGTVIDASDTALDAMLTGAGSLGFFAIINGINHAQQKFDHGMDGVEAVFEGAGVAIEGTAKGIVDASEMIYKVAMSKPSRFIGRLGLKALKKLDDKMMG